MGNNETVKTPKNEEGEGIGITASQIEKFLQEPDIRVVRLFGYIGPEASYTIWSALLEFQKQDPLEPVTILINSPGGDVIEALSIWDAIHSMKMPIYTVGTGKIMSAGAFLMYAGTKGCRILTPNAVVMAHQMSYGTAGKLSTMNQELQSAKDLQTRFMDLIVDKANMGGTKATKRKRLEKHWLGQYDQYFFAEEAIAELGLADGIGTVNFGP